MIIFFDTETTGLPKNYNAPADDLKNWPRIIQLAWSVYNESGELVKRNTKLIKPDGWEIPKEEFWIKNGYTTEKSLLEGVPIKEPLQEYVNDRLASHYAVAHNLAFDSRIIRAEMIRAGLNIDFTAKKICTMMKSTDYCQIPYPNGRKGVKWPTLTELYNKLFGSDFEGAHDAGSDVDACAKCFFELLRQKVIVLD